MRTALSRVRSFVVALMFAATGCDDVDSTGSPIEGLMTKDGYSLFSVENDRQQWNDVAVTVRDPTPGATYVLLYSAEAPRYVGWFQLDLGATGPCTSCATADYGEIVDVVKVPDAAREVILRGERCGCEPESHRRRLKGWTGYWAIMRIERSQHMSPISFDVDVRSSTGDAMHLHAGPAIRQRM